MAKRFSDTGKWNKPFMRGMEAPYKLLWLYILDECDHAGIWQIDIEVAQLKIGEKFNLSKAKNFFDKKIIEIDGGEKWFIPDFIEFQYNTNQLNPSNKVHESILKLLRKFNLVDSENTLYKGYASPLQGAKDKDKDMDREMDREKEKDPAPKIISVHTQCKDFYEQHQSENNLECNWNGRYASDLSQILRKLKKTFKVSNGRESTDDDTVISFKYLIQQLPEWFKPKPLSIINSSYDSIVNQIKDGRTGNKFSKTEQISRTNADQFRRVNSDTWDDKTAI